jgi:hypothetical protein
MATTTARTAHYLAAAAGMHVTPAAARRVVIHLLDRDSDWYLIEGADEEAAALHELADSLVTSDDDVDDFRAELTAALNPDDCGHCGYFRGHTTWCPNRTN